MGKVRTVADQLAQSSLRAVHALSVWIQRTRETALLFDADAVANADGGENESRKRQRRRQR